MDQSSGMDSGLPGLTPCLEIEMLLWMHRVAVAADGLSAFPSPMKVFISWSGDLSKDVAELFKRWLKCVLQATEPFLSNEDIAKGAIWFDAINDQLQDTSVGIICLTRDNI